MAKGNKKGNPNIAKYGEGTRFKKGYKPINPGPRKNLLKDYINDVELSANDVNMIIKAIIACSTLEDIEKLRDNKETPFLIRYFCKLFIIEFENGDFYTIEKLFNRAFGMPQQDINLKSNVGVGLTQEQKLEEVQKILEKAKKQNE